MVWRIEFAKEAAKEFDKLAKPVQQLIRDYLRHRVQPLANPRLVGKPLTNDKSGLWRYRVEKYRIVCKFEEKTVVILILRIGKRDKVYD